MAFLELLSSGERFMLHEDVNVISNEVVINFNTIVIKDESVQNKHAVITRSSNGLLQIVDICSNGTSLKTESSCFEPLEPMKFYKLNHLDVLRFGNNICVKFYNPSNSDSFVEYSQQHLLNVSVNKTPKFFVPATETLTADIETQAFEDDDINIPETQRQNTSNLSHNSLLSGVALLTDNKLVDRSSDTTEIYFIKDGDDDELDGIETFAQKQAKVGSVESREDFKPSTDRDSSVTPDLIINIKPEPESQSNIETQINPDVHDPVQEFKIKMEKESQKRVLQSNIDTQVYSDFHNDENFNSKITQATQPLWAMNYHTRQTIKRQAELKPKTVSLTNFDDDEEPPSSKRIRSCFAMETQAIGVNNNLIDSWEEEKKIKSGLKVVNRILVSSDEDSEEEQPKKEEISKVQSISDQEITTWISLNEKSPCSPRVSDSPIMFDDATPDFIPKLPSDSQLERFLEEVNASQTSNQKPVTVDDVLNENGSNVNRKKSPKLTELKPKKTKRKLINRLMKYDSDSEDDSQPTSVKVTVEKILNEPSTSAKASNLVKEAQTDKGKDENAKPKTSKLKRAKKNEEKKEPAARIPRIRTRKSVTNKRIASTNIKAPSMKQQFEKTVADLGGINVDRIQDADLLFTNNSIRHTSKFLASICKGIPIVGSEFFEQSAKAGKFLNPQDYIVTDEEFEKKKKVCIKTLLEKVSSNPKKLFHNHSVIATSNNVVPFEELVEIVTNGGGECVKLSQKPRYENLIMLANERDTKEIKQVIKKYPKIIQLKDTHITSIVFEQTLNNRM